MTTYALFVIGHGYFIWIFRLPDDGPTIWPKHVVVY